MLNNRRESPGTITLKPHYSLLSKIPLDFSLPGKGLGLCQQGRKKTSDWRLVVVMVRNEKYWILSRHKFLVRPSQFARSGIRRDNKVYINKTQRLKVAQTDDGGDGVFKHFKWV